MQYCNVIHITGKRDPVSVGVGCVMYCVCEMMEEQVLLTGIALNAALVPAELSVAEQTRAEQIMKEKYGNDKWNGMR